MTKISLAVLHYSAHDPRTTVGGVQTFARNLTLLFEEVRFATPKDCDFDLIVKHNIPVICDNQHVVDWPAGHPVIGFQHGVGAVKFNVTRSRGHRRLARAQRRAAKRQNTLWVANAEWVAAAFGRLYGNRVDHVIYYPVDVARFDAQLDGEGSRLILHDARTKHKGEALIEEIKKGFPKWQFEPLDCKPDLVPDRMRHARAFIHLSRYEGNSIVCNEAMAMNLPCMFTAVGLMQDRNRPTDVYLVDPDKIYGSRGSLIKEVGTFLESLDSRIYNPREWILANATPDISLDAWNRVMTHFQQMSGWNLGMMPIGEAS